MARISLKQAANRADGRSRACAKCPVRRINPKMCMQCSKVFVEGFMKGHKYAKECDKKRERVELQPCGERYTLYGLTFGMVQAIQMALELQAEITDRSTIKEKYYATHYKKHGDIVAQRIDEDMDRILR